MTGTDHEAKALAQLRIRRLTEIALLHPQTISVFYRHPSWVLVASGPGWARVVDFVHQAQAEAAGETLRNAVAA